MSISTEHGFASRNSFGDIDMVTEKKPTNYVAIGMTLGLAAGLVIGAIIGDRTTWVGLGLGFGVVAGALVKRRKSK